MTTEELREAWLVARRTAADAAEESRAVYVRSHGPNDPAAIAAKAKAEAAIAVRDAAKKAYDDANGASAPAPTGRPKGQAKGHYEECRARDVPENVRFTVPRENQGQMVEEAYGSFGRGEGCHGDPYKRVTDTSIGEGQPGRVRYFQLEGRG